MEYSEQIRNIRIVDLINKYPTSVRLRNCIDKAQKLNNLPFETIGNYLDAISTAKDKLLEIENLGRKTADELIHLIDTITKGSLPPDLSEIECLSVIECPEQIRNITIVDLVNTYAKSAKLRNRI